ncbi:class F sortase [Agrococcus lahaulensis]|uniref:class F sortase n=1 Tax=Agrococcus lahaulensis TaxID=341722 RepID=UPI000688AC7E|nr:class F sortase [Agrococcus lahaulensis]
MRTTDGLPPRPPRREPARRAWRPAAVLAAIVAAAATAIGVWLLLPDSLEPASPTASMTPMAEPTPTSAPSASTLPDAASTAAPVPTAVGARDASIGADQAVVDAPTRVQVPSVGIDLEVIPVGVREDGQMDVPELVREVGWYRFGPAPGADRGSAVLSAHVDSDRGRAPMAELLNARAGESVEVATASGADLRFRIVAVERFSKDQLPLDAIFARDGDPLVRLITCGGEWDAAAGAYEDNIVVTAVPDAP